MARMNFEGTGIGLAMSGESYRDMAGGPGPKVLRKKVLHFIFYLQNKIRIDISWSMDKVNTAW